VLKWTSDSTVHLTETVDLEYGICRRGHCEVLVLSYYPDAYELMKFRRNVIWDVRLKRHSACSEPWEYEGTLTPEALAALETVARVADVDEVVQLAVAILPVIEAS
jgi:hypothetical protein